METTHMVEIRKMRKVFYKYYRAIFFIVTFLLLPLSFAGAVTYNSGLYNVGYYSSTAPSTTVATPGAGTYNSTQSVALTASGSTSIRYSTTSTPANCSSGTLYSSPIQISSSTTLYVKACDNQGNYSQSEFEYIISKKTVTGTTALFRSNFLEQQKALNNPDINLGLKKFTRSLSMKMTGEDVRALQVYLNTHGYVVATLGPGSPGKETNYFGLKTKQALIRFQKANKISPIGIAGPITRAVLNK